MQSIYAERIVAFIDILGFRALVRQLSGDSSRHTKIKQALTEIRSYKKLSVQKYTDQSKLEVSVFSDSIAISGSSDDIFDVIWSAIYLQCRLLALGILVRGGISRGQTVHTADILYGEGMLNAYDLESKVAIYPRIILDPKLLDDIEPLHRAIFLTQDTDGLWFIDPFSLGVHSCDVDALLEDGYNTSVESLESLRSIIDHELSQLSDVNHLAKWQWLKSQYGRAIIEYTKLGKPRFWHIIEEAKKNQETVMPSVHTEG